MPKQFVSSDAAGNFLSSVMPMQSPTAFRGLTDTADRQHDMAALALSYALGALPPEEVPVAVLKATDVPPVQVFHSAAMDLSEQVSSGRVAYRAYCDLRAYVRESLRGFGFVDGISEIVTVYTLEDVISTTWRTRS